MAWARLFSAKDKQRLTAQYEAWLAHKREELKAGSAADASGSSASGSKAAEGDPANAPGPAAPAAFKPVPQKKRNTRFSWKAVFFQGIVANLMISSALLALSMS